MMMIWALGHSTCRLLRLGYGWDVGGLGELVVTIDFIMYTDFNSIKQKLQVISHCLVPISLANWRYEKDTFLSSWKRNVLTVQIISPPVRFDLSPSSILSHLHLWFISTGSYIGNTSTHAHTHTPSFHLLCSACEGPAVTNQASNDACMGWSGGGGVMEVERNMERLREPSSTPSTVKKKKDQSAACRVCLSICAAVRRRMRGSQWKKWCVKERQWKDTVEAIVFKMAQKCTVGGLWANT